MGFRFKKENFGSCDDSPTLVLWNRHLLSLNKMFPIELNIWGLIIKMIDDDWQKNYGKNYGKAGCQRSSWKYIPPEILALVDHVVRPRYWVKMSKRLLRCFLGVFRSVELVRSFFPLWWNAWKHVSLLLLRVGQLIPNSAVSWNRVQKGETQPNGWNEIACLLLPSNLMLFLFNLE